MSTLQEAHATTHERTTHFSLDWWLARSSIAATAFVLIALAVLHLLRPDYNPFGHFISEYAVGPHGWLMTSVFFAWAIGSASLALGMFRNLARPGRSWLGLPLLLTWALSLIVAGIYPTDLTGATETPAGIIHGQAAVVGFSAVQIMTLLISSRWRKDAAWKTLMGPGLALGALIIGGFVFLIFCPSWLNGFAQRIMLGGNLAWMLLAARRLRVVVDTKS
ncbi:MAG: DUF998 domain-containing protein [Roseiflexaceae bacterium]|nr:DUF998 domain-containing protein [Roseiflexaceae bacterium]